MRRLTVFAGAVVVSQMGVALAADQPAPAQPPVTLNVMGQNMCMAVVKPQVAGMNFADVPQPVVRTEITPPRRDAKHTIVFGELGTATVEEQLGSTEICMRFPAETLFWADNADGRAATATTCLRGIAGERIHLRIVVQANGEARAAVKNLVAAVAACDMAGSQSELKADDTLRIGTIVVPRNR